MSLSGETCKSARALAGLTQAQLAIKAEVATKTISDFENGYRKLRGYTELRIKMALEEALSDAGLHKDASFFRLHVASKEEETASSTLTSYQVGLVNKWRSKVPNPPPFEEAVSTLLRIGAQHAE